MLICDTHADTLYALQSKDRDPSQPLNVTKEGLTCTNDVRVQALALFTGPHGLQGDEGLVERELFAFQRLKDQGFRQITRLCDAQAGAANVLLTVEGGDVFHGGLDTVDEFFERGVRAAALVWNNENALAYPALSGDSRGLTAYGRQVVGRMQALGMAVDVSHLNPQGVWDLLQMGGAPPMASHSCARALCDHPRNLTDDQLRGLFSAGGFVGVNFYPIFLDASGQADLDRVIDHMAHMCQVGGEAHVGLGSDFDGIEIHPRGLQSAQDVPALLDRMRERGFSQALVRAIAGENFRDYLERVAAAARS